MKYILSLLLLITVTSYSQDTVTLVHKAYKTTYSKSKHYPVKVEWWLTKASLTCDVKVKRGDKFIPDPKLSSETNLQADYTGQGFDRGHNFPAADASCDQVANEESFYFSNLTALPIVSSALSPYTNSATYLIGPTSASTLRTSAAIGARSSLRVAIIFCSVWISD